MKLWAHRGCSQRYPENTLLSFEKAKNIAGLTGIELDVQLTKDGQLVVIHDERVDRTTEGIGSVKDFTLEQLRKLHIYADDYPVQKIPTLIEVLELLQEKMTKGLLLNIELKNSVYAYPGMEDAVVDLVHRYGLQKQVIYSSFYANSLQKLRSMEPEAELGILDTKVSDCLWKVKGGCGANALHPYWTAMDLNKEEVRGYTVRAWFAGHLYPEKPTGTRLDLKKLEDMGITDVIINEPEVYLDKT